MPSDSKMTISELDLGDNWDSSHRSDWTFETTTRQSLRFTIVEFYQGGDVTNNILEIGDGWTSGSSTILPKYIGTEVPISVTSASNNAWMTVFYDGDGTLVQPFPHASGKSQLEVMVT